ncbi:Cytochrome b561 [BD1-7 clade bacterium]|nr:Cytochrome b561 [BD1-7 clade bacterium]
MDNKYQLSALTIVLHWLVAFLVIAAIAIGYYMSGLPNGPAAAKWVQLHKSIGVIILFVAVLRLGWRWKNGWLNALSSQPIWQNTVSKWVLGLLMVATLVMPISGITMSYAGGHDIRVFGYLFLPGAEHKIKALSSMAWEVHETTAIVLLVLIGIHLLATIKHQWIDKDSVLRRMLGFRVDAE